MNPISNNPFRILGVSISAGEREIVKQINTLSTYASMGKTKTYDNDFAFLPSVNRELNSIEEAKKLIEQNEGKLFYSFFWFWENNSVDELALDVLKEGDINKAISIWEKSIYAKKKKVYKPIVLFDNLISQSTNWPERDIEDHILKKNEDEYIIERKKETSYSIPTIFVDFNFEDNWTIECDTKWLDGVDDIGYGIVFGRDDSNFYTFQISGNGSCIYGKFINWDYVRLMDWKVENAINRRGSNHISIEKIVDTLNFRINGQLVYDYKYEPFFGKYFGFKVTNNQKISFRNFKLSKLIEDESYGEGINVSSKNFSSIKNLSTLYLGLSTRNGYLDLEYLIKGVALAKSVFTSNYIEDYSKFIAGERYIYNSEKIFQFYINEIIDSLKKYLEVVNGISTKQLIKIFLSFPVETKQILIKRFVSNQIQNIEKEIETAVKARNISAINAVDAGKKLVANTKTDILYLKKVLDESDYNYQFIADKLSDAIVRCGIEYFNTTKNDELFKNEYEYALSIAVTQRAKEYAQNNLNSCKEWIANKHYYMCWFCGKNPPDDVFIEVIYKINQRYYFPRRVEYSYMSIKIPRCNSCKEIQSGNKKKYKIVLIISLVLGLIIGIIADGNWFAGMIIGGATGWIAATIAKSQNLSKTGVKSTSHLSIKKFPPLSKLLREGWQFSRPSA
jgi:hypothetical protein